MTPRRSTLLAAPARLLRPLWLLIALPPAAGVVEVEHEGTEGHSQQHGDAEYRADPGEDDREHWWTSPRRCYTPIRVTADSYARYRPTG